MKAVVLDKVGKPEVLKVKEVANPIIKSNEVLVKIKYAGINYAELLSRQGLYSWAPKRPYILGIEGSGVIEEVGSEVLNMEKGDRVAIGGQSGTYAEYIAISPKSLFKPPKHLNIEEIASFLATWGTAWVALHEMARVRPNERILIQAGAGGVGTAAIQLAKQFGMEVYATSSTKEKRSIIEGLGATALTYDNFDEVLATQKPDMVLESVGGDIFRRSYDLLEPMGRLITIGASGIRFNKRNPLTWWKVWKSLPKTNIQQVIRKSRGFMGLHIGYLLHKEKLVENVYDNLVKFMETHELKPIYKKNQIFNMSDVAKAHQFIHDRKNIGKVLLDPRY